MKGSISDEGMGEFIDEVASFVALEDHFALVSRSACCSAYYSGCCSEFQIGVHWV